MPREIQKMAFAVLIFSVGFVQCDDNEKIDPGISGTALMGLTAQLPCEGSLWPCRTSGVPEAP